MLACKGVPATPSIDICAGARLRKALGFWKFFANFQIYQLYHYRRLLSIRFQSFPVSPSLDTSCKLCYNKK